MSHKSHIERAYWRATNKLGILLFSNDLKGKLTFMAQRASKLPQPLARLFKLVVLALLLLLAYLNLPSNRLYTTELALSTLDLRQAILKPASPNQDAAVRPSFASNHVMDCTADIGRLVQIRDKFKLGNEIEYLKRYVRFTREPIERQSYTWLQQRLVPGGDEEGPSLQKLDLTNDLQHEGKCSEPLELTVTQSHFPVDVDLSDFIFAISTSVKRLSDPLIIDEWAFWLTNGSGQSNGGKLILRLLDANDPQLRDAAQRLAEAGIDAEISALDSRLHKQMAVRYFDLVSMLYSHVGSSSRKWFVLCDDDTFFPSIHSLVERFKQYNHDKLFYIGTLSEDAIAVKTHGSQAFGGAGVFISRPLAKLISQVHETCKTPAKIKKSNSGWGPQGDILLRNCIYENSDVRLLQLDDLWQLDVRGDASGFYESGVKPYSIHHFKGGKKWHSAYPLNTTAISFTCGEDCPYQRFITKDDFIITNGYSIALYPRGIDFNLDQVERTFRPFMVEKGWNFDYTYGPQRPSLRNTGKKVSWELFEAQANLDDGSTRQTYVRKKNDERWTTKDGKPMKTIDGIIELVWISS